MRSPSKNWKPGRVDCLGGLADSAGWPVIGFVMRAADGWRPVERRAVGWRSGACDWDSGGLGETQRGAVAPSSNYYITIN